MSKNLILIAAIGGAVLLVLQKQAQAAAPAMTTAQKQAAGLMTTPTQQKTVNMNGDMWARLLGSGWTNLVGAQNTDGSPAFLMNSFGQVTTSDGKPVDGGDPLSAIYAVNGGLPAGSQGTDYTSSLFPTLDSGLSQLGWSTP